VRNADADADQDKDQNKAWSRQSFFLWRLQEIDTGGVCEVKNIRVGSDTQRAELM
jgi:hypothetical protein